MHIAVRDLSALGRAALLPEDDLNLATVLKGPMLGFSEEELFELAFGRADTLWDALFRHRKQTKGYGEAYDFLREIMAKADYAAPFEFFSEILARGGKKRLLTRLGPDALDPIEEFLSQALAFEAQHPPSLEGFLHWFEGGEQEIKRDLDIDAQAVRIMTVHGAKGLEAPVIFMPDTMSVPTLKAGLFWGEGEVPVWAASSKINPEMVKELKQRAPGSAIGILLVGYDGKPAARFGDFPPQAR